MLKNYLFVLLFLTNTTAMAQFPPSQLLFQHLTVDKGLSEASNHFIYKDSRDFVWISSTSGLNRFDGTAVKIYRETIGDSTTIKGANINGHFLEDTSNNLWFSTYTAVNCYHRDKDNFSSYTIKDSLGQEEIGYFTCGLDAEGKLWLLHNDGLYEFDIEEKTFRHVCPVIKNAQRGKATYTKEGKIKRIFVHSKSGTKGFQIITFDTYGKTSSEWFFSGLQNPQIYPPVPIAELVPENDSLVWLITGVGLAAFNLNNKRYQLYQAFDTLSKEPKIIPFLSGYNFDEDYLILSSHGNGICFFNKKTGSFSKFYTRLDGDENSMASNSASHIYVDKDKDIWTNTQGLSLDYSSPKKIKYQSYFSIFEQEIPISVLQITKLPKGQIWLGDYGNKNYIINDNYEILKAINQRTHPVLAKNSINYRFVDAFQRVWLKGWGSLFYYDLQTEEVHQVSTTIKGQKGKTIEPLFGGSLRDGTILFTALDGGIYKVENPKASIFEFALIEGIDSTKPYTTFYQYSDGLIYANENANRMLVFNEQFEVQKTVPINAEYNCYYEPPGDSILWIGTNRGLVHYNKLNDKFRFFAETEGLPNAMIYGIVPHKEDLWLSTNAGLAKFNPKNGQVETFNRFDGLSFLEFKDKAYLKKENGEILFGTINGLTAFHPDSLRLLANNSSPRITSIKINDEIQPDLTCEQTGKMNVSEIEALQLDYKSNTLSFEFSALDYSDSKHNKYRYKLLGADDNWIESGTRNFVRYSNLPAQSYEFQLYAANSDDVWSQTPLKLGIDIIPPIHQRTWFQLLMLLVLGGMVWLLAYLYHEYKFGKQLALEKQKLFWARKMHEDLGADYSSLKLRTGMLVANLDEKTQSGKEIHRITDLMETVSKQIRGITWSLNYKNDRYDKLMEYLQEYAHKNFEDTLIRMHFPLPDSMPQTIIDGETRMTILHVFKEALNNVHKHSEATDVHIEVSARNQQTQLKIVDNGKGFQESAKENPSGNGLNNMRERMKEVEGACIIKSNTKPPLRGTAVTIVFPY